MKLLTRQDFREDALKRDRNRCVVCTNPATAVHHIMERALFDDGGYYLTNAASLCDQHHLEAEWTTLSCDALRKAAGIAELCLPEHLATTDGEQYDKWGNAFYPNGRKYRGELWWSEACQKALSAGGVLKDFSKFTPYPRTMHLPWSPGLMNDDRMITALDYFQGKEVVVTLKMDGEGATLYRDGNHARSLDSRHHESRAWIKRFHAAIAHEIPEDWRLCGENMYALHTLPYANLESFFYLFNIWEKATCLSWDDTLAYANVLGLTTVKTLYHGPWDEKIISKLHLGLDLTKDEGFVVRLAESIRMSDWRRGAAKFVRARHVGTSPFWMNQRVVPNALREGATCAI
jgi:hypothetical protein